SEHIGHGPSGVASATLFPKQQILSHGQRRKDISIFWNITKPEMCNFMRLESGDLLALKAYRTERRHITHDRLDSGRATHAITAQEANDLSGGEQQMLTICRTLMGDPDLIMIDEPTEGLAPMMVSLVAKLLEEIAQRGISILLVEQKLTIALKISHRLYVMGHGHIVFEGSPQSLIAHDEIRQEWLEV
ncbi:MAG: ATP-binding cassette domain-containing protein, partial [Betaproteobacteria bacterium]|nr:ATP-binding cassette domain-containing protein [Betaproteobacteria bacterium]